MKKLLVTLAVMLVVAPALAENKFTEDELTAMELANGAKKDYVVNEKGYVLALFANAVVKHGYP